MAKRSGPRLHRGSWLVAAGIVGAGVISIPSTLAALPAATPSPTTMTVTVRDDPHHVALGDAITYTIVASNNGDTENTDFLLVVSWEPETEFDSFIAPPGWTVNLPGSIPGAPFALSTFNDPMSLPANSSVTFTLVLTPQAAGQFEMAATLFSMLPNQTQSTEIERTPVTAAHGH